MRIPQAQMSSPSRFLPRQTRSNGRKTAACQYKKASHLKSPQPPLVCCPCHIDRNPWRFGLSQTCPADKGVLFLTKWPVCSRGTLLQQSSPDPPQKLKYGVTRRITSGICCTPIRVDASGCQRDGGWSRVPIIPTLFKQCCVRAFPPNKSLLPS